MRRLIFTFLMIAFFLNTFGQKATITISYTATLSSLNVQLDSIKITNDMQGNDTTLYSGDTTLVLVFTVGLTDHQIGSKNLVLQPNYPNPFMSRTVFDVYIPEYGDMSIYVYDISGKEIVSLSNNYLSGVHSFSFITEKAGFYILSVTYNNKTSSIKMYSISDKTGTGYEINYLGKERSVCVQKSGNAITGFSYTYGDQLSAVGYYQSMTDIVTFIPLQDTIIEFNFQGTIPCPSTLIDTRDNNLYSAVQIGNQCWMSENLAYLPSVSPSSAGSSTTPYYYVYGYQGTSVSAAKATSNYSTYGVLYNWPAAMAGATSSNSVPSGVQGICPSGWHLPSDEEWKILEGEVDSQYGYPDPEWDGWGWRGTDAGGNLKEIGTTHWDYPNVGATNNSGFTALPAGRRYSNGSFSNLGSNTLFWSSTENNSSHAWYRYLHYTNADVHRDGYNKTDGFSVRCIKD